MKIARRKSALHDLARRGAYHATKRACEVGRIGEPGRVGRARNRIAARKLPDRTLQAKPQHIRAQRYAYGCGEQMQEPGWRESDTQRDRVQRHRLRVRKALRQLAEDASDPVIDRSLSTIAE